MAAEVAAGRTVTMIVTHPDRGQIEVQAYCAYDAKLGAMIEWGMDADEARNMKVYVDKKQMEGKDHDRG